MQQRASFAAVFIGVGIAVGMIGNQLLAPYTGDRLIRDYLMENPEVIVEAMTVLQAREETAQRAAAQTAVAANLGTLHAPEGAFVGGNPNGDVTIVEFFDYNCGFCRQAMPELLALMEEDTNLRVVFFELPILSDSSIVAARASLASARQGRYMEYHTALMDAEGRLTEDRIMAVAEEIGLDLERLREDMNSDRTERIIRQNRALAQTIQVNGTPTFVVGDELTVGWNTANIRSLIEDQRSGPSS